VSADDRLQVVRDSYRAYESGDRDLIEACLTDDFTFYCPADVGIDRARYFGWDLE
jgi:ketosteroid isomerase-like protein